ncbi:MAG TPA: hypothetical protein VIW24_01175 [Aldersonia sp.]
MSRLTVIDEMFLRRHRGFGTPIAMQGLWRTADRVEAGLLIGVHNRLRHGPLARRVVRSRIPGARASWVSDAWAIPLDYPATTIVSDAVVAWADVQARNLDPSTGPPWFLSATTVSDGGTVVSLCCSHAVADAQALVRAADLALTGTTETIAAQSISDWRDARTTWRRIITGTRVPPRPGRSDPPVGAKTLPARTAILAADAAAWDAVAADHGGSANSVFVAVVVGVLRATGERGDVDVGLPIDQRGTHTDTGNDSATGNAMGMASTTVHARDTLATIHDRCRDAFAAPDGPPPGLPPEWLHVLPARLAHAATRGAGEHDVLCSNIGTLPDSLAALGPHRATGVATRALHPGLNASHLADLRTRLAGYLCRLGDTYTLALVAFDAVITSDTHLRDLAAAELDHWGMSTTPW